MFAKSLITQLTHFDVSNTIVIIELSTQNNNNNKKKKNYVKIHEAIRHVVDSNFC